MHLFVLARWSVLHNDVIITSKCQVFGIDAEAGCGFRICHPKQNALSCGRTMSSNCRLFLDKCEILDNRISVDKNRSILP